jgi:hypothetical protein
MKSDAEIIDAVNTAFLGITRPEHFTNYMHCSECLERDQTLLQHDCVTLRVEHVNNPAWDPITFCSEHGKAYFMPALVRFALLDADGIGLSYWQQLLSHLEGSGPNHALITYCTKPQQQAIAMFLEHLIDTRTEAIEKFDSSHEILRTHEYWANSASI